MKDRMKNKFGDVIENFTDFSNEIEYEEKKSDSLGINVNKEVLKEFKDEAMKFFVKEKAINFYSFVNYFRICVLNVENKFLEKYGEIKTPDENYIKFYQKNGRVNNSVIKMFYHVELENMLLNNLGEYHQRYFNLMHTHFTNVYEPKSVPRYSASIFFYDFWGIAKEEKNEFQLNNDLIEIKAI